jgi:hypothetical protein
MLPASYLRKEQCDPPILVTIDSFVQENVAPEGQPQEEKWVMYVREHKLGLVLNSTNLQLLAQICSSQDTDEWIGKQVVLWADPAVNFGGRAVGGIRVRAPKNGNGKPVPAKPQIQPSVTDVNRKLQEAADDADYQRGGASEEF